MQSFVELLRHQFEENADNPAIIYHNEILTFGQLEKKAEKVGAFLQEKGLEKSDRAVLYTPEKLPFLIIHLGIILGGGVSLPLNFNFTKEEMIYFLNDSGARFVFASDKQAALIKEIKDQCPELEEVIEPAKAVEIDVSKKFKEVEIEAEDHCFILYSSGTTGRPKGVVHTHRNVAASLLALQKCWKFTPEDILLNALPLFHIHGLSFATHLALVSGGSMILGDRFHPLKTMEKIKDATVFMGVPTIYYAFLRRPEFKEKAKKWYKTRLFTCGSAPIRSEVLFKQGSVGLPIDGIEMKLVSEDGKALFAGTKGENGSPVVGEVKIRSKNLFSHYWNKPEATSMAFDQEGFFSTGDLGYIDENGFLTLVGRKDDLIITHGYNVYPPVIEGVLNEFAQVKESAVIGIPDQRKGEKVIAIIVPNGILNIKELKKHCQAKLVNYQRPVHFELVKELPRNTMGKILKRVLKEKFTERI